MKKSIISASVSCELKFHRSSTSRGTSYCDMVWITTELSLVSIVNRKI
jgi:hypothetical protein